MPPAGLLLLGHLKKLQGWRQAWGGREWWHLWVGTVGGKRGEKWGKRGCGESVRTKRRHNVSAWSERDSGGRKATSQSAPHCVHMLTADRAGVLYTHIYLQHYFQLDGDYFTYSASPYLETYSHVTYLPVSMAGTIVKAQRRSSCADSLLELLQRLSKNMCLYLNTCNFHKFVIYYTL